MSGRTSVSSYAAQRAASRKFDVAESKNKKMFGNGKKKENLSVTTRGRCSFCGQNV